MTTPDGLTAEEREVLRSLGGASLFEYDAARYHDEQVRDSMGDVAYYDRRILLVTVDRAVRTLARHVRETGCHHAPDCPHFCQEGHYTGDDMVMTEQRAYGEGYDDAAAGRERWASWNASPATEEVERG